MYSLTDGWHAAWTAVMVSKSPPPPEPPPPWRMRISIYIHIYIYKCDPLMNFENHGFRDPNTCCFRAATSWKISWYFWHAQMVPTASRDEPSRDRVHGGAIFSHIFWYFSIFSDIFWTPKLHVCFTCTGHYFPKNIRKYQKISENIEKYQKISENMAPPCTRYLFVICVGLSAFKKYHDILG